MAKWFGAVGYATQTETATDVIQEVITTREYYGDLIRRRRNLISADQVNDNVTLTEEISIVADPYAYENAQDIRYATVNGVKWKVTGVTIERPRLLLTLGGVYNEYQS